MNPFKPTHEITVVEGGVTEVTYVQLVDGAAYTRSEWLAEAPADWERHDDGSWTFQGGAHPTTGSVSVRELHRA